MSTEQNKSVVRRFTTEVLSGGNFAGTLRVLVMICLALGMAGLGSRSPSALAATPTTLTVATCDEASLASAVSKANTDNAGDTIAFACNGTITFTSPLFISGMMTVDGSGHGVTFDGGHTDTTLGTGIFVVDSGGNLTLNGLTLRNGYARYEGGAIFNDRGGTLTITSSTLSGNTTSDPFYGSGGAIDNYGTLTITSSTFSGNSAASVGGAIANSGTATITSSTFSGNSAPSGGAIYNADGTASITSSTFSGNSASETLYGAGGAIENSGTASITSSTFSRNSAVSGGGAIFNTPGENLSIGASIIVSGSSDPNCSNFGTMTDLGYNLEDAASSDCGFSSSNHDLLGQDPALGSLTNNGGPTETMALTSTSPAVDQIPVGTSAFVNNILSKLCVAGGTDQRGLPRPDNGETTCDIGAYEYQDPQPTTTTLASSSPNDTSTYGQSVTFTATVAIIPPGTGTPTGTVTFFDGATALGTGTLAVINGVDQATFTTSSLAVGTHSITAAYGGDDRFNPSTSGSLTQQVAYAVKQAAVANAAGKLVATVQLQDATGTNLSSSGIPVTALQILNSSNQTVKTLNAPFTYTTTGPVGFVGGIYGYTASTGLGRGAYTLVYQAGNDPTMHSVSFTI